MVSQRLQHLGSVPCNHALAYVTPSHRGRCLGLRNIVNVVGEDTYTHVRMHALTYTYIRTPTLQPAHTHKIIPAYTHPLTYMRTHAYTPTLPALPLFTPYFAPTLPLFYPYLTPILPLFYPHFPTYFYSLLYPHPRPGGGRGWGRGTP